MVELLKTKGELVMGLKRLEVVVARGRRDAISIAEYKKLVRATGRWNGRWKRAAPERRTVDGIVFDSLLEASVYERLRAVVRLPARLVLGCRFPLIALQPSKAAKVQSYLSVDFTEWAMIAGAWSLVRAWDAKPKKWRSRDWRRGSLAFQATYGIEIVEVSKPEEVLNAAGSR